ncbi:MAG: Co2+/Mg2+ efflux protein ApaG [Planctomycetota bacterium]|nr:Co2+/Mg2+ efflux protein ApaG [Planctomycetota bacterium]
MPARTSIPSAATASRHRGSSALTRGVRVDASPVYMRAQSTHEGTEYLFGYRIVISNQSDQAVQVVRRRWTIIDGDGCRREVEGEGVIGQRPILEPGESFEYASFCPLPTRWGTMEGSYLMAGETGEFHATIARFFLVADDAGGAG